MQKDVEFVDRNNSSEKIVFLTDPFHSRAGSSIAGAINVVCQFCDMHMAHGKEWLLKLDPGIWKYLLAIANSYHCMGRCI